jgi:hypothetical protein
VRIGDPSLAKAALQATAFDPDGLTVGVSDRFIERIGEKRLSIPAIPGLAMPPPRTAADRPSVADLSPIGPQLSIQSLVGAR